MAERVRENNDVSNGQAKTDLTAQVVSVARRRVLKAGLTAPLILTLRSKPLFGETVPGCSAWLSASYRSGIYNHTLSGRIAPTISEVDCARLAEEGDQDQQ